MKQRTSNNDWLLSEKDKNSPPDVYIFVDVKDILSAEDIKATEKFCTNIGKSCEEAKFYIVPGNIVINNLKQGSAGYEFGFNFDEKNSKLHKNDYEDKWQIFK